MPRATDLRLLLLLPAAVSCSELTVIGVSDERDAVIATPAHRTATQIIGQPQQLLQSDHAALGDIDGDGYDDFILTAAQLKGETLDETQPTFAYLFYGRPSFGEQLTAAQADATFETPFTMSFRLGDVNGDGLADFVLKDRDAFEIVFGSKTRLSGRHAMFSTGIVVTHPPVDVPEDLLDSPSLVDVRGLGDVNGDGNDDIAVGFIEPESEHVLANAYGLGSTDYIVLGRADNWPTGQWDSSWASAQTAGYGDAQSRAKLTIYQAGDLDGDGYSDVVSIANDSVWIFYGKPELEREITPEHADAELVYTATDFPTIYGDLDADGADDLFYVEANQIGVVYGKRFSGRIDLTFDLSFLNQGPYSCIGIGDTNGDGHPDLLFLGDEQEGKFEQGNIDPPEKLVLYEVRGTGKRLTGEQHGVNSRFQPVDYNTPLEIDGTVGIYFSVAGDLDGDRSSDLLVAAASRQAASEPLLYLLPGAMNQPQ